LIFLRQAKARPDVFGSLAAVGALFSVRGRRRSAVFGLLAAVGTSERFVRGLWAFGAWVLPPFFALIN